MSVVDASLVAKWLFPEDDYLLARILFRDFRDRGEAVVAPHLLPFEIMNIVRQRVRRGVILPERGMAIANSFFGFRVQLLPQTGYEREQLHRRAVEIAHQYDLPAAYDAHYVALAESLGCELWTADERLINQLGDYAPFVHILAGFEPTPKLPVAGSLIALPATLKCRPASSPFPSPASSGRLIHIGLASRARAG